MKTTHLIGILAIAIAIVLIITTAGDASQYLTFDQAKAQSLEGNNSQVHVVGQLKKNVMGEVQGITPSPDMLSFKFIMIDENGKEVEVFHPNPMPTDFVKSEQVVVVGGYKNDKFVAEKILLKCPSKYQEENVEV